MLSDEFVERSILVVLAAAIGAFFKPFVDWLWERLTRPELLIDYSDSEPGFRQMTAELRRDPNAGTPGYAANATQIYNAMYVSIRVRNERSRTARNCRGFLIQIEVRDQGKWTSTDYGDCIPLAWSYRPDDDARNGIDIPRGVNQFLNVLSVRQPDIQKGFRPATVPPTLNRRSRFRFQEPGEFRFTINVSADNAETRTIGLFVRWEGDWENVWDDVNCKNLIVRQDTTIQTKLPDLHN